jgi:hypothetical protein
MNAMRNFVLVDIVQREVVTCVIMNVTDSDCPSRSSFRVKLSPSRTHLIFAACVKVSHYDVWLR